MPPAAARLPLAPSTSLIDMGRALPPSPPPRRNMVSSSTRPRARVSERASTRRGSATLLARTRLGCAAQQRSRKNPAPLSSLCLVAPTFAFDVQVRAAPHPCICWASESVRWTPARGKIDLIALNGFRLDNSLTAAASMQLALQQTAAANEAASVVGSLASIVCDVSPRPFAKRMRG